MKDLFSIILLTAAFTTFAQVGINNDSPKATLDISTSATLTETDGLLVPRVPSFATTNPGVDQNSMLVYLENDLTNYTIPGGTSQDYLKGFYFWDNTAVNWIAISGDALGVIDADGDTQIQVEESADEDLIRFDVEGQEQFVMTAKGQLAVTRDNTIRIGNLSGNQFSLDRRSVFIGEEAGRDIGNNFYQTAVGYLAMQQATGSSNNGARNNTAIGAQVLQFSNAEDNTGLGNLALNQTTTGSSNTAVGGYALRLNTTGGRNVGVGRGALQANTTGGDNTAFGTSALAKNVASSSNTAIGVFAMFENISGTNNTAVGASSSQNIKTGTQNVSVGDFSLYHNADSGSNVAIGQGAGFYEQGANNTFIGRGAGGGDSTLGAGAFKTTSGNVMIGYEAGVFDYNGGNKLYIENSNSSVPLIAGDFSQNRMGINTNVTTDLTHTLNVGGSVKIQTVLNLTPGSQPGTATEGDVYYDSTTKKVRVFTGIVWENLN